MDFARQLRIFVAVVDHGSFSRAAEALRMTRPSVTKAIGALERSLGARLLHRTTRRVSPTGEGELFHQRATGLLGDIDEARNLFGGNPAEPRGRLRVDIPMALSQPLIVDALPDFTARHPLVDLILGVSDQPVDLVADAVDCVLRIGALPPSSMVARKLADLTMVICGAPAYLDRRGVPDTLDGLPGHVAVNYFSGRGHRPLAWSLPGNGGTTLPSAIMVNDTSAFVSCALAGMGLIQVPALLVAGHIGDGTLVQVLPGVSEVRWPMSIMYPNRRYLAPQVRAFISWLDALVERKAGRWLIPAASS